MLSEWKNPRPDEPNQKRRRYTTALVRVLYRRSGFNALPMIALGFLTLILLGSLLLTTLVIEVPFIANAFGFTPIGWDEYGIALALAIVVIPVVELVKLVQRAIAKR